MSLKCVIYMGIISEIKVIYRQRTGNLPGRLKDSVLTIAWTLKNDWLAAMDCYQNGHKNPIKTLTGNTKPHALPKEGGMIRTPVRSVKTGVTYTEQIRHLHLIFANYSDRIWQYNPMFQSIKKSFLESGLFLNRLTTVVSSFHGKSSLQRIHYLLTPERSNNSFPTLQRHLHLFTSTIGEDLGGDITKGVV